MSSPKNISYFGYGSLVNLNTLRTPYIDAIPAQLSGWRRLWVVRPPTDDVGTEDGAIAFLSVERHRETTIQGMVVLDYESSLPSLDQRESLYDRHKVEKKHLEGIDRSEWNETADVFVYVHKPALKAKKVSFILRSYLDAVSQGFLAHFGEEGVWNFKRTTQNFHFPILEDRDSPIYPRPVELSRAEESMFDAVFPKNAGKGNLG